VEVMFKFSSSFT